MKTPLTLLCALLLWQSGVGQTHRTVELLDTGWRFALGAYPDAPLPGFDDSQWQMVSVPHDWAIAGPFDMNNDLRYTRIIEDGDKTAKLRTGFTGSLPTTGIGWYRKRFTLPDTRPGDRIRIEFDGVMNNSTVWLNGQQIGGWRYGYVSFPVDGTNAFRPGEENLLVVKVDNLPEMSRFYSGAGIYRNVRLVKTSPLHVGYCGTFVRTPLVTAKKVVAEISTEVENYTGKTVRLKLVTEIYGPDGKLADTKVSGATAENPAIATEALNNGAPSKAKSHTQPLFDQRFEIKNPALWDTECPNLYRAVSKLYAEGELCDTYETTFGLRDVQFDAEKGMTLNGRPLKIKGVCLHHDLGPLGAAVNERATQRQLQIMKEMGCNAIRTSHNPPSPELLRLCDEMGLLVQVEFFDEWEEGKCPNGYNKYFGNWAATDITATIRRDRNHPSVIMWSIGNEVREQTKPRGGEIAAYLAAAVRAQDTTRPTTCAFNSHTEAIQNGMADAVDLVGFNYKPYDYGRIHNEAPQYILYGSETASAISSRGVYKLPAQDFRGAWYPDYQISSYGMDYVPWGCVPDTEFAAQEDNTFSLGEFVWTGFDYLGEPTPYNEGAPSRSSYFGIVDLAGLPKDSYYLYKSHWSDKPVLHLLPHWNWEGNEGSVVPVVCYTNYPRAELFINGESQGVREKNRAEKYGRYRLMWPETRYEPGELKVVAYDKEGNLCGEEIVRTAGVPARIVLTADRTEPQADGKDLVFITAQVVDKEGNPCPTATSILYFSVHGNGRLKALCNGDATDQTSFASNYMRLFSGKLVAVVETTRQAGDITVTAISDRLANGTVRLNSQAVPIFPEK